MADEPATDRITIRHKTTRAVQDIARTALPFFPDWEQVDSAGRRVPEHKSTGKSDQKEN